MNILFACVYVCSFLPACNSALQPWVSLGLLYNRSPLLSIPHLLFPSFHLQGFHYITFGGKEVVTGDYLESFFSSYSFDSDNVSLRWEDTSTVQYRIFEVYVIVMNVYFHLGPSYKYTWAASWPPCQFKYLMPEFAAWMLTRRMNSITRRSNLERSVSP
jgi:hypothetical protein